MRFEAFVALRYVRGKRKSRFVNLITIISVAGVSVGVMALIVVLSVMSGFDRELTASIMENNSHISVGDSFGAPMEDPNGVIDLLKKNFPDITAASPFIQISAGLRPGGHDGAGKYKPVLVVGIDPATEGSVTNLAALLSNAHGHTRATGRMPQKGEIVLGCAIADDIGATVGDLVGVTTLSSKPSPLGIVPSQTQWLTVCGISQAAMSDFDATYTYVTMDTAQMIKQQKGVDGIHCMLTDPLNAEAVAKKIDTFGFATTTWYQSNEFFFEALKQEKVVMAIILMFIVLVAAFNITSTLIMVVMEKKRDIGILRTLGVGPTSIIRLFMLEGLYIGLSGTVAGLVLGTVLAFNLNPIAKRIAKMFGIDLFNSVIYHFDHIPVAVVPRDVGFIMLSAIALTFVSTLYPAWSASRLDPVDALRYE